ncbi:MAG: peptide ABC transporter ATP-binding protein, partial [Clostridiales bacterium]|nr:peptide ABC transporter ATP-binding protein [Clostridiales bacterium]
PIPSFKGNSFSENKVMKGELTSPIDPKPGCRFSERCPYTSEKCIGANIPLKEVDPGHYVACILY